MGHDPRLVAETGDQRDQSNLKPVAATAQGGRVGSVAERPQHPPHPAGDDQRSVVGNGTADDTGGASSETLEVDHQRHVGRDDREDLVDGRNLDVSGQEVPLLPQPAGRPQDLRMPDLDAAAEDVHVDLDHVGSAESRNGPVREVARPVSHDHSLSVHPISVAASRPPLQPFCSNP